VRSILAKNSRLNTSYQSVIQIEPLEWVGTGKNSLNQRGGGAPLSSFDSPLVCLPLTSSGPAPAGSLKMIEGGEEVAAAGLKGCHETEHLKGLLHSPKWIQRFRDLFLCNAGRCWRRLHFFSANDLSQSGYFSTALKSERNTPNSAEREYLGTGFINRRRGRLRSTVFSWERSRGLCTRSFGTLHRQKSLHPNAQKRRVGNPVPVPRH
jgi:hypothetical protein